MKPKNWEHKIPGSYFMVLKIYWYFIYLHYIWLILRHEKTTMQPYILRHFTFFFKFSSPFAQRKWNLGVNIIFSTDRGMNRIARFTTDMIIHLLISFWKYAVFLHVIFSKPDRIFIHRIRNIYYENLIHFNWNEINKGRWEE